MSGYSTTDTFASLVEEVRTSLQGNGIDNDQTCALSADILAGDLLIGVDDTQAVSKGVIEIDEELIFVKSNSSGTLTIAPYGRGFKGTTAAVHSAGAMVSVAPTYPKSVVSREVNNAIRAIYPELYVVAATEITADGVHWQYALPSAVDQILLVESKWTTWEGWQVVNEWDASFTANTTDFATGQFLSLGVPYASGTTVRVTYKKPPTLLANSSDAFAATTGLPSTSRDVIVLGTAIRLLPWIDTGRVPTQAVAQDLSDQTRPIGNAVSLAKELRNSFNLALQREKAALERKYPRKSRRTR